MSLPKQSIVLIVTTNLTTIRRKYGDSYINNVKYTQTGKPKSKLTDPSLSKSCSNECSFL